MSSFKDIVKVSKASACATCQTYIYEFEFPIQKDIATFISTLGAMSYNLEKYKLVSIDNEYLYISGIIGRTSLKVKYKSNVESYKSLVELQLAAYIEAATGNPVELI